MTLHSLVLAAVTWTFLMAPALAVTPEEAFQENRLEDVERLARTMLRDEEARNDAEANAWLARVLYRRGRFEQARQALDVAGRTGLQPLLARGDFALFIDDAREALASYGAALASAPDSLDARLGLATAYMDAGRLEEASELANRALPAAERAGPYQLSHALSLLGGAQALKAQRGLLDAVRYGGHVRSTLLRAVSVFPANPYAHYALGRFYMEAPRAVGGDPGKAVEALRVSVSLNPNYFLGQLWLIRALRKAGLAHEAQAQTEAYRRRFSGLPRAMQALQRP